MPALATAVDEGLGTENRLGNSQKKINDNPIREDRRDINTPCSKKV